MEELVEYLARSLVDEPDAIGVALDLGHPTPRVNVSAAEGEIAVAAMFALFWTVQTIQLEHESSTNPPGAEQVLAA